MANKNQSIEQRLLEANIALENASTGAEIQTYMAEYGYNAEKISEGKSLYNTAQDLHNKQKAEYGDQYTATDARDKKLEEAEADYIDFVKIARISLRGDRGSYLKLNLDGIRKKSFSGRLSQAKIFYVNALADAGILAKLSKFSVTKEKLEAGKKLIDETEAANAMQKKESGEAQQATLDRDEEMDKLDEWMGDFKVIARIALKDKPQLLEKLGIVEPS
jgi:hypothetical protein